MKKWQKHNLIKYVLSFLVPVLFMVVFMAVTACYPFGENTILFGDANGQLMGFFREWLTIIKNGGSILFNWNGGYGEDFFSSYNYYLASPFNWLVLLFGEAHLELGIIFVWLLQLGLVGAAGCFFFSHTRLNTMENGLPKDMVSIMFSVAYSMCNFILVYQHNVMWLISFILLPFVMLGIEALVFKNDIRLYIVSLFLVFVTNFYFAWFICLFAIIWFLDQGRIKKAGAFICSSILSALCGAAVLLPSYAQALTRVGDNPLNEYGLNIFGNLSEFIQSFFWGNSKDLVGNATFANNNYLGVFALLFAFIYIVNGKASLEKRVWRFAIIVFLAFSLNWIGTIYIFHGFTLPYGCNHRFGFWLTIMLLVSAFEGVVAIRKVNVEWLIVASGLMIAAIFVAVDGVDNVEDIWFYYVTLFIFVYLAICVWLFSKDSIKKTSLIINIFIIAMAELLSNGYMVLRENGADTSVDSMSSTSEWGAFYQAVETETAARKSSSIYGTNTFWYSDTNVFSSTINNNMYDFLCQLGLSTSGSDLYTMYYSTTPLTAALLNVDYVLTDNLGAFGGYAVESIETLENGTEYFLCKTSYDTSFAFMTSSDILSWDVSSESGIENQNNFTRDVLAIGDIFTEVTLDNLEFSGNGTIVTSDTFGEYNYTNVLIGSSSLSAVEFTFTVEEAATLYVEFSDENKCYMIAYIDDQLYCNGRQIVTSGIVCLGDLNVGQTVKLVVANSSSVLSEGTTKLSFYSYNKTVMDECLAALNETPAEVISVGNTSLEIAANVTEGNNILYTSIPYYKGWSVYVDGEKVDVTLIADALIGVELEAGDHVVEFKYFPYGLKLGIILSIIGIGISCIIFKRRGREEVYEI